MDILDPRPARPCRHDSTLGDHAWAAAAMTAGRAGSHMGIHAETGGSDVDHEPRILERGAQHYAAIPVTVTMEVLAGAIDEGFPAVFGWLAERGITPSGPPLIRYLVINMTGELKIELGVPVGAPVTASGRIQPGVLPEGRYAVLRHTGPYDGLIASNAALEEWAREHKVEFDSWSTSDGTAWRGRAEHYLTDPSKEPDPAKLETDVAYLTRDPAQVARSA
jgi:effector-binding domain-containing protein